MKVLKGKRTLSLFLVFAMALSLFATFPVFAEESAIDTSGYTVSVLKDGTGDGEDGIMTIDKWNVVSPTGHPTCAVVDSDTTSATYGQLMFNMLYGAMTYTYEANSTVNAIDNYVAEVTGSIWGGYHGKAYVKLKTVGSTTYYLACWYYGQGSSMQTRYAITTRVLDDYYGSATQYRAILSNEYSILTSKAKESAKWKFVVVGDKIEVYRNDELIISYQNEALKGGTASFGFGGKKAASSGPTTTMYISDVSIFKEAVDTTVEYTQQNLDDNFVRLLLNDRTFTKGTERTFKVQIPADGNYAVFVRKVETANNTFRATLSNGTTTHSLENSGSGVEAYAYNYVRLGAVTNPTFAAKALTKGEWTLTISASAADITVPYIDIRSTIIEIDGSKQAIYPSDFNDITAGTSTYVNEVMQSTQERVSGYDYYADYMNSNLASTWLYDRGIRIQTGKTATYKLNVAKAGAYVINMNVRFRTRATATSDASTTVTAITATGNSSTAFTHTYPEGTGTGVNTDILSKRCHVVLTEGANEITVNPTSSFADMYLYSFTIEPVEPYIEDGFSRIILTDKAFVAETPREFEVEIKQDGDYAVFLQKAEIDNTNFTVTFTKDGETKTLWEGTSANDSYAYNYVRIGGESGQTSTSVPLTKGKWTVSVKPLTAMDVSYIDVRKTSISVDGSKQAIYPSDYNTAEVGGADFINGNINKTEYERVSDYDYYADYTGSNVADTFAYGRGIQVGSGKSVTYKLNVAKTDGYKIKLNGKLRNNSDVTAGTVAKATIGINGNDEKDVTYTYEAATSAGTETEWSTEYDVTLARGDNVLTFTAGDAVDASILGLTIEFYDPNKENNVVSLAKEKVVNYMAAAKEAYVTDAYANYTNSIINSYLDAAAKLDCPQPVSLSWDAIQGAESYTLLVSKTEDFTSDVLTFEGITETSYNVPNLYVDTVYYWKVQAAGEESEVGVFYTDKTVRYINVEGVRNFRDIGGWNGLNQGMAYRGSAMDPDEAPSSYGGILAITDAGKKVLRDDLGIRTDLDFRNTKDESPLGSDINFVKLPNGNYTSAYTTNTTRYKEILQVFTDIDNYPIYFHCSGGADRTGTVAFVIEALCGVAEEDLAIDFELTSLCSCFGTRPRHDTADYFYASTVAKMKEFEGNTLQEKAEDYALNLLGLTRAEVSNIQSILAGNAVVFESGATVTVGRNTKLPLKNLGDHTVSEVTVNDKNMDFSLNGNILTVKATEIGKGIITFDDGNILTFDAGEISGCIAQTPDAGFTRLVMQDPDFTADATCKFPVNIAEAGEYAVFLNKGDTNENNFEVTFEQNGTVVELTNAGESNDGYAYNYVRAGTAELTAGDWIMCITPEADTTINYVDMRSTVLPITGATQAIYPSDFNTYTDIVSAHGDVNGQMNEALEKISGYSYIGDYEDADLTTPFAGDRGIYFDAGKTVTYKLNVKQAGTYKLTFNHSFNLAEAADADTNAVLTVTAGDNEQTKTHTYSTGEAGKTEAKTTAVKVTLTEGEHTLSFKSDSAGSYLYHLTAEQVYNDKVVAADNNLTRIETDAEARTIVAGATRRFDFTVPADGNYNFFGQIGTSAMTMKVTLENADTQEVTTVYNGNLLVDNNRIARLRKLGMGQTPAVALTKDTNYRLYLTPSIDITVPFIDVINLNLPVSGKTAISAQYYSATNITDAHINNNDQVTKQTTPAKDYTLVGNFLSSELADQSGTSNYSNFSKFYAVTSFISNTRHMSYTLDVQETGVYQIQVDAGVYAPNNALVQGSEIMEISVDGITGSPQYTGTSVTSVQRLTGPSVYLTEGTHTLTLNNPAGGNAGFYIHQILATPVAGAGVERVEIDGSEASVSAYLDGPYTGTAMVALYSSNNELVGVKTINLADSEYFSEEITLGGTPSAAKVFVWDDLDSMTPLIKSLEITNESSNWRVVS